MLITWKRIVCDEDDEDEKEMEVLGGGLVVPDCCEHVREQLTVTLSIPFDDLTDDPACERDAPAGLDWVSTPENGWKSSMEVWLAKQPEEVRKITRFDTTTPYWSVGRAVDYNVLVRVNPNYSAIPAPPVICCPHCGTKLPEIERTPVDELPGPVHRPVSDGDYCSTCHQRSRNCRCLYPTALWRTVKEKK